MPGTDPVNSRLLRARDACLATAAILALFCAKYLSNMLQQNEFWRSGAWYEFLSTPSQVAAAGLLDQSLMEPYYRTLSVSVGHQLVALMNQWFGYAGGTAALYIWIAAIFILATYLISFHLTGSRVAAFVMALIMANADALALGHIGASGQLAQHPGRDYLALGPILLGFYFLLQGRLYAYWACLFAGFLFHLPHGCYAFALLLPLTLMRARGNARFLALHFLSFGLTALALYMYQASGSIPVDAQTRDLWFKWTYIFNGGHIYFDHSINYLVPDWAFLSILLAGIAVGVARQDQRSIVLSIVPMWIAIALVATVFIYVVPVALVHQLTPYRSSLLVSAILLMLGLHVLIRQLADRVPAWRAVVSLAGFLALVSGTFAGVSLFALLVMILLATETSGWERRACIALAMGGAVFLALILLEYKKYDALFVLRNSPALGAAFIGFSLLLIARRWRAVTAPAQRWGLPLGVVAAVCLIAAIPSRFVAAPTQGSREVLGDFMAASKVVKDSTAPSEPVLAAPFIDMPMLEVTAGRGSVLQLVKAHVPYLAPALLPRFNEVLRSFGIDIPGFKGTWVDLIGAAPVIWKKVATEAHLATLGRKHNARLVVTYVDHKLKFPVIYAGKHFIVYRLAD